MGLLLTTSVGELPIHVFEPIAKQTLFKIVHDIGFHDVFDERIYFKSDITDTSVSSDVNDNPTLRESRIVCNIRPSMNPQSTKFDFTTPSHFNGQYINDYQRLSRDPIFLDIDTGSVLTEHCVPATITLECVAHFKEFSEAYQAQSRISMLYSNTDKIVVTDLAYDYPLPQDISVIMYKIYKMYGGVDGGFFNYLQTKSRNDISASVNRHKMNNKEIIIGRSAFDAIAIVDMTQDKPSEDKISQITSTWTLEFTVSLQFDRVELLMYEYPIIVKNELVPKDYIFVSPEAQYGDIIAYHPNMAIEAYLRLMNYPDPRGYGVVKTVNCMRLPWYDNWMLPANDLLRQASFTPFVICAFTLDDIANPTGTTIIQLDEPLCPGVSLKPEVIQVLKNLGPEALSVNDYLNVAVYASNHLVEPTKLKLDDGLKLIVPNRNINKVYRLVISEHRQRRLEADPSFRVAHYDIVCHR